MDEDTKFCAKLFSGFAAVIFCMYVGLHFMNAADNEAKKAIAEKYVNGAIEIAKILKGMK
tara:strand:+ start:325 stop:504 length:180 start_codon:yes stop_codon:yes gene_type:complete